MTRASPCRPTDRLDDHGTMQSESEVNMTTTRTYEARLTRHFEAAGAPSEWYRESRSAARAMARKNGVSLSTAAGVIAALSPKARWAQNLKNAAILLESGTCGGFKTSVRNAQRILSGERPLDVMNGPKTREFYRAIMGDEDAVVLDVWMARAFGIAADKVTALYEVLAAIVRKVAASFGVTPATLQAAVWTHVRGSAA